MSAADNSHDIVIPDIGDAENVEVIEMLVSVGDSIAVDDSLLTLESDKASMEVPSTNAGVITSLSIAVGDTVNAGDVIGTLRVMEAANSRSTDRGDNSTVSATSASDEKAQSDEHDTVFSQQSGTSSSFTSASSSSSGRQDWQGSTKDSAQTTESPAVGPHGAGASAAASAAASRHSRSASPAAHINEQGFRKAHASPGVRRYAREHGADLSLIDGSGPKGRISKDDVRAYIKRTLESSTAASGSGAGIPPIPVIDFSRFGDVERVPLGRINKLSAANLHRAWLNLPMVTHHEVADVTDMEAFRKQLKSEAGADDPKVTGLAFHMKALVKTLQTFPKLNSSLTADGEALYLKHYFHIGIAVDTPNGLVVPVFRDVDKKSVYQLAREMADVSNRAREKKLKPDEMQGASMTISSLGGIGGTAFTPIVNPPEVAILGITRATMQPVWNGSEFVPRLLCPLDLTYDHRVVDGAEAARFMAYYARQIGDIRRLTL